MNQLSSLMQRNQSLPHNTGFLGQLQNPNFKQGGISQPRFHQNRSDSLAHSSNNILPANSNQDYRRNTGSQPRDLITDKIILDIYSKTVVIDGQKVLDATYQSHVLIKEYSQFPSYPPPSNTPISGSIKDRVLTLCSKHSGRILIQKGKFNDQKNIYQIGRTWDIDELSSISRIGPDEIILKLNKDYYWKIDEGPERTLKFIRSLCLFYSLLTEKYPLVQGINPQELNLPSLSRKDPRNPTPNSAPTNTLRSLASINSVLSNNTIPSRPKVNSLQDYYKDFDFTSNGQLPMKPMKVIERGSSSSIPYEKPHHDLNNSAISIITEDNFNFAAPSDYDHSILEPEISEKDSIHNSKVNRQPDVAEKSVSSNQRQNHGPNYNSAQSAVNPDDSKIYNKSLESEPKKTISSSNVYTDNKNLRPQDTILKLRESTDFGIEEVSDEDEQEEDVHSYDKIDSLNTALTKNVESRQEPRPEEIKVNAIDSSIQEIENLLDSQFSTKQIETIPEHDLADEDYQNNSIQDGDSSIFLAEEEGLNLNKSSVDSDAQNEVDPEIDEILDEVNWDLTDSGDSLIRKLTEELQQVKGKNIRELVSLDFSNSELSNEFGTSIGEVENLARIFRKIELEFKLLSTQVGSVETNSKGVQVKFLNEQNLHSILQELLLKVSVRPEDLDEIANFQDFDRINNIQRLELKLKLLYDALITIRDDDNTSNEGLSSMMALRKYQGNYENVTRKFVMNFSAYFEVQLKILMNQQSDKLESFDANKLLKDLNESLVYSGITFFIKYVDPPSFREMTHRFNSEMGNLLERLLGAKLKRIQTSRNDNSLSSSFTNTIDEESSLRKSRTLRLSRKDKSKKVDEKVDLDFQNSKRRENEIEDPSLVNSLVKDAKDLIIAVRYFIGSFYHYDTTEINFEDYLLDHSFHARLDTIKELSDLRVEQLRLDKSYATNESISSMSVIFGSFINMFLKKVNPVDYRIPQILTYIEDLSITIQGERSNQDFLMFNFLRKIVEKFKSNWNKFIANNIDSINKIVIVADCGVLPIVKNMSELITTTERSKNSKFSADTAVSSMLDKSYSDITEAFTHMFMRDDPLLKNHEFDDKERVHRNISILQNIFFLIELLAGVNTTVINKMRAKYIKVFDEVKTFYFQKQIHKTIGKINDFIHNYETLEGMTSEKSKKFNKKHLKTLLAGYTSKDITQKAQEIYRKLEKHFLTGDDIFERDLVNKLWIDIETIYEEQFQKLNVIIRKEFGSEIDYSMSKNEIHSIFWSIHH